MKRCDRCGGSGLATTGVFTMTADCPDCNGSGWVDRKIDAPPPAHRFTVKTGLATAGIDYKPGDIYEDAQGRIYRLSERRIWERVDVRPPAPAAPVVVKKRPKKKGKK